MFISFFPQLVAGPIERSSNLINQFYKDNELFDLIKKGNILIMLFIVPMWMNFLLRTYAWLPILGKNGFLNTLLGYLGFGPFNFLYNDGAVILGMIYNFLPFMVLPIFNSLSKMDNDLINAARDLGANNFQVFTKVIFPLSLPGVVSGITNLYCIN